LAKITRENATFSDVEIRTALARENHDPVWRETLDTTLKFSEISLAKSPSTSRHLVKINSIPGEFQLAIAIEQSDSDRFGVAKEIFAVQKFDIDSVSISDLMLLPHTFGSTPKTIEERKRAQEFLQPRQKYSLSDSVGLYFEIYNLPTDIYGRTRYEISYKLQLEKPVQRGIKGFVNRMLNKQKETVIFTYRESGKMSDFARPIDLDLSMLKLGRYQLTVQVTDEVFNRHAEKSTELIVTP
jgi:hypothetical protein